MTDQKHQLESLQKIASARRPPIPWEDGDKIPWNDPEFSRRLMAVHLDQTNVEYPRPWLWTRILLP